MRMDKKNNTAIRILSTKSGFKCNHEANIRFHQFMQFIGTFVVLFLNIPNNSMPGMLIDEHDLWKQWNRGNIHSQNGFQNAWRPLKSHRKSLHLNDRYNNPLCYFLFNAINQIALLMCNITFDQHLIYK